ncbi:unnamed protein product [Onchocerca ochengi]|uniref:Leucine zipper transcription factor-like protein 1 n=1 Tax=Onchocerca ochengi TaxID=42157 RepID=A0A182ED44_ONCOC|nr:unnamed protein product [Onchocerca ochengi]
MNETTLNVQDVEDEAKNENLVRDYLLHQLQLNLLHAHSQDKVHAEAVEELMETKRTMQEMEDDVTKFHGSLKNVFQLKKIEQLSIKRQTILDTFNGDAKAYLANHQAKTEQLAQLEEEIKNQRKVIAALDDRISAINSMLQSP